MNTLSIIITGVIILLLFDIFLMRHIRKKRKGQFKLVIEKARVIETQGEPPSEFLYDLQQLARINNIEALIINGKNINTTSPDLEFLGNIEHQLKQKLVHSLTLSLQKNE